MRFILICSTGVPGVAAGVGTDTRAGVSEITGATMAAEDIPWRGIEDGSDVSRLFRSRTFTPERSSPVPKYGIFSQLDQFLDLFQVHACSFPTVRL